jgi:phage gp46-like protein
MVGDGWLINDDRNYELTDDGHLVRDDTILTRCRIRLLTRRGEWFADPELGSRFHTIKNTKNIKATIDVMAREALAPMIADGSIQEITDIQIHTDPQTGSTFTHIFSIVGDQPIDLGSIPLTGVIPIGASSAVARSIGGNDGSTIDLAASADLYQNREIANGNVGYGWLINDDRNYELTDDGKLARDPTLSTRCRIRLLTRRGEWFADPELGSLLHTIQHMKNIRATVKRMSQQALQPLIDDGEILAVDLVDVVQRTTTFFAVIEIAVPGGSALPISAELPGVSA